jgi:rhomboid family GlyGly-CTERM serine protease
MKSRLPIISVSLSMVACLVHAVPSATIALQWDREAASRGEFWRWFTAHVTHFGANHLAWDAAALFAIGWVVELQTRIRTAATLVIAAPTITGAISAWQPELAYYRGLSGLDSALFGLLAAQLLRRAELCARLTAALALAGTAAKCAIELRTDATLFAHGVGYVPVPLAHAVGLVVGVVIGLIPKAAICSRAASSASPPLCR